MQGPLFALALLGALNAVMVHAAFMQARATVDLDTENGDDKAKLEDKAVAANKYQYVHHPRPEDLSNLTVDMSAADLKSYDLQVSASAAVKVFGYPTHQDMWVSGSIASSGQWEGDLNKVLCNMLLSSAHEGVTPNFLDVGANIGVMTLTIASCVRGKGEVVSVEGLPSIANHLKAGVKANALDNVLVYNYAVSGPDKADSLTMALNPTNKGGSAVVGNKAWTNSSQSISVVPLTTLDAMMLAAPVMKSLRVAKFDIEGNEGRALQGAHELFSKHPPCTLVIELSGDWMERAGTPGPQVVSMIAEYGYDTSAIPYGAAGIGTYTLNQHDMPGCLARLRAAT